MRQSLMIIFKMIVYQIMLVFNNNIHALDIKMCFGGFVLDLPVDSVVPKTELKLLSDTNAVGGAGCWAKPEITTI